MVKSLLIIYGGVKILNNMSLSKEDLKILIILIIMYIVGHFTVESISLALPAINITFDLDPIFSNWISLIFYIFCVGTGLIFGKLLPQYGIVKTTIWGTFLSILGTVFFVIGLNPMFLLIGRALQGVAESIIFVNTYIIIINQYDNSKLGWVLGIITSASFIGSLLGPTLGAFVIQMFNWHTLFLIILPLLLVQFGLLFSIKSEWKHEKTAFDSIGAILSFVAIALFVYGTSFITSLMGIISLIISIILLLIFVRHELKTKIEPIYELTLLKNIKHFTGNYISAVGMLVRSGIVFILGIYLQNIASLSALESGLVISIIPFIMFITSPIAGTLSDKYDSFVICEISLIFMIISLFFLTLISDASVYVFLIAVVVLSLSCSFLDSPSKKIALETVPKDKGNHASSFLSTIRDFGMLLGVSLFTLTMNFTVNAGASKTLMFATQTTLTIFTLISVVGLLLIYYSKEVRDVNINTKLIKKLLRV